MIETQIPELDVDPIALRLQRIVDGKRVENEAAIGTLTKLEAEWTALNKEVNEQISEEFQRMTFEEEAAAEAIHDLKEERVRPLESAFVIAGKVRDVKDRVGLPEMIVRVEAATATQQKVTLPPSRTNALGGFTLSIEGEQLDALGEGEHKFAFSVFSDPSTLVHTADETISVQKGQVEHVTLLIRQVTDLSDRIAAGKAVRDSVHDNAAVISARVENMRTAHTEVAKLADRTRAELKSLREQLSAPPPSIPGAKPLDDGGLAAGGESNPRVQGKSASGRAKRRGKGKPGSPKQ